MKKAIYIFLVLFLSCKPFVHYIPLPMSTDTVLIQDSELKVQSVQCIANQITGGQSGGVYQNAPSNNPQVSIDGSGCFNDDDLGCDINEFYYIVENDCDPPCYDSTSVFYYKCCLDMRCKIFLIDASNPTLVIPTGECETTYCEDDYDRFILRVYNGIFGAGNAAFNYVWSNSWGQTMPNSWSQTSPFNLPAGVHTASVEITDLNGCKSTLDFTITIESCTTPCPTISMNCTGTNPTCFGDLDGSISATATGGQAPYSYAPTLTGLAAGNYQVTVTDDNDCTATCDVTLVNPPALNASIFENNCNLSALVQGGTGTAPYAYNWVLNGISIGSTQTITATQDGTYNVEIKDSNGCLGQASLVVTDCDPCNISLACSSTPSCSVGSTGTISAVASGGTPNYTYNTTTTANITGNFTNLAPGNYALTVTDANGCTETCQVTVGSITCFNPTVSLSGDCLSGLTTNVTATCCPSLAYQWFFNGSVISNTTSSLPSSTMQSLGNGTYGVRVSCFGGCVGQDLITVTNCPVVLDCNCTVDFVADVASCQMTAVVSGTGCSNYDRLDFIHYLNTTACSGQSCGGFIQTMPISGAGTYILNSSCAVNDGCYSGRIVDTSAGCPVKLASCECLNCCNCSGAITFTGDNTESCVNLNIDFSPVNCNGPYTWSVQSTGSLIISGLTGTGTSFILPSSSEPSGAGGTYIVTFKDANGCEVSQFIPYSKCPNAECKIISDSFDFFQCGNNGQQVTLRHDYTIERPCIGGSPCSYVINQITLNGSVYTNQSSSSTINCNPNNNCATSTFNNTIRFTYDPSLQGQTVSYTYDVLCNGSVVYTVTGTATYPSNC